MPGEGLGMRRRRRLVSPSSCCTYERVIAALRAEGFTDVVPAHLAVMRYPGPDGRRPVQLAPDAGLSRQAMNYLLGQLESLGYIERRPDEDDGRGSRVYATEPARSS